MAKKIKDKELLIKLVVGLKTLKEEEFNYKSFVSRYDFKNICGTVCCAWGWVPKFAPESGIVWEIEEGTVSVNIVASDYKWITVKPRDVDFMFYGHYNNYNLHDSKRFGDGFQVTLKQVINRIEYIIKSLV